MRLYQQIFQEMLEAHKDLFTRFKDVHDRYVQSPVRNQVEFNQVGTEVMDIIRKYENRLCGTTERGGYSKYSHNLSEKFWSGVRVLFPKIDFVGVI